MSVTDVSLTLSLVRDMAIGIWTQAIAMVSEGSDKAQAREWRVLQLRGLLDEASETLPRTEVSEVLRQVAKTFERL